MTLELVRVIGNRGVLVPRGWDVFRFEGRTYRRVGRDGVFRALFRSDRRTA